MLVGRSDSRAFPLARAVSLGVGMLLGSSPLGVGACSTATIRCNGTYPTVTFRTLDWDIAGDLLMSNEGKILFEPPGITLNDTLADYDGPTKYGFVSHFLLAGSARMTIEGMNEKGVSCSVLEQQSPNGVTQAASEPSALKIQMPDACTYLLANFGSVEEIKTAIQNGEIMIDASDPTSVAGVADVTALNVSTQLVFPAGPGQLQYGFHLYITDGAPEGEALVYEGDAWMQSNVLANDAPDTWNITGLEAFEKATIENYGNDPTQIPYNDDNRFPRLYYSLTENCSDAQFPEGDEPSKLDRWSPGYGKPPAGMDKPTFMALKRAENMLQGFIIPQSPLWGMTTGGEPESTQAMYLKSPADGVFYWKTPRESTWLRLDIPELSKAGKSVEYSIFSESNQFGEPAKPMNGNSTSPANGNSTSPAKSPASMTSVTFAAAVALVLLS